MKNVNKLLMSMAAAGVLASAIQAASAATATAPVTVSMTVNTTCTVSTAPTTVAFTYTSGTGGTTNSTGGAYGVTCTNGVGYTMSISAASGTLVGVNYGLSVDTTGKTGNGAEQTYAITGSIAGPQTGTCGTAQCVASDTTSHTLTITY